MDKSYTKQMAKHLRDVYFGGNWTTSNYKDVLKDVTWQQATTKVYTFNTIDTLVYHTGYYISAVAKVLEGEPLNSKDELSFNHPLIQSEEDWQNLLNKTWADVEHFASLIEQLPESIILEPFTDEKYGNYFRNIHGIIEHLHYHLGQIVIIKKLVQQAEGM
jgi:hypothetical protein